MASIAVERVTKTFSRHLALDQISLEVKDREFLVLLGPSGCGKTTLLNVIAGLESPDSGSVFIDGQCVDRLSPGERDLGFVFQSYALYPSKTVRGNLEFALRFRRNSLESAARRAFVQRRVREVAEMLRIENLLDRYPSQLSGGQRQRVAMGRALVRQPRAFLFDEPLSNLDAVLRLSVRQEIRELHAELWSTMVYVTHDQSEAMSLGQRIVLMNEGRILEVGAPQDVYERPTSIFTARFIGSPPMNLLDGHLRDDLGRIVVHCGGGQQLAVPDSASMAYRSALGRSVAFGVRAEDIDLVDRFASSAKLKAEVVSSEFQGSMWLVHAKVEEERLVFASSRQVEVGRQVVLFLDMTRIHLFNPVTGKVIYAEA